VPVIPSEEQVRIAQVSTAGSPVPPSAGKVYRQVLADRPLSGAPR
jgi:hypothetical protein